MRGNNGSANIVKKEVTLSAEDILMQLHCFEGRFAYLRRENSTRESCATGINLTVHVTAVNKGDHLSRRLSGKSLLGLELGFSIALHCLSPHCPLVSWREKYPDFLLGSKQIHGGRYPAAAIHRVPCSEGSAAQTCGH